MKPVIVAATIILAASLPALAADAPQHEIAVQGEAEMTLAPDYATVEVGVITQGTVVTDVLADNSARMSRVVEALHGLGIVDADIHTSDFVIEPRYKPQVSGETYDSDAMRPIVGYAIDNKVTVTVTDMKKIASVIDTTARAGANDSGKVDFGLRNTDIYLDKVRAAAIDAAHHKAEVFTAAAHVKLGRAIQINDNRANTGYNRSEVEDIQQVPIAVSAFSGADPTPILTRQITVSAAVTVVYATD